MFYWVIGIVLLAIAVPITSFLLLKRRKFNSKLTASNFEASVFALQTDEEKIIKMIKSTGGTMRQSAITNQSGFSKAKTSLLLTALEKKGIVLRTKKGRDKIVKLNNKKVTGGTP